MHYFSFIFYIIYINKVVVLLAVKNFNHYNAFKFKNFANELN